jgi:hypothetical protein
LYSDFVTMNQSDLESVTDEEGLSTNEEEEEGSSSDENDEYMTLPPSILQDSDSEEEEGEIQEVELERKKPKLEPVVEQKSTPARKRFKKRETSSESELEEFVAPSSPEKEESPFKVKEIKELEERRIKRQIEHHPAESKSSVRRSFSKEKSPLSEQEKPLERNERRESPKEHISRKEVRDSMIGFMLDPRKIRDTPDVTSVPVSIQNPTIRTSIVSQMDEIPNSPPPTIENSLPLGRRFSVHLNSPFQSPKKQSTPIKPIEYFEPQEPSPKPQYSEERASRSGSRSSSRHSSSRSSRNSSPVEEGNSRQSRSSTPRSNSSTQRKDDKKNKKSKKRNEERTSRADELKERMKREELKEKRELVYEFWVMEKQGIPVSRKYTAEDNIDEMRFEYHRLKSEGDIKDKIKIGWSAFSLVNNLGEAINQKWKPLGVSLEGWGEELDSSRLEYEKIFKKIYKNMASKFYVRPGLQLMTLFGSQLALFILPRLLSKFKNDDENKGKDVDDNGKPIPPETIKKIGELQTTVNDIRKQFSDQLLTMQQQQIILAQAQQKFFEQMTLIMKNSKIVVPDESDKQPKIENPSKQEESETEYEYVEVTDNDETEDEEKDKSVSKPEAIPEEIKQAVNEDAANSIGEVVTQLKPLVDMFRAIKTRDKNVEVDQYMYEEAPEVPESMLEDHKRFQEKGYLPSDEKIEEEKSARKSSKRNETWNLD